MTGTRTHELMDATAGELVDALAARRTRSLELTEALIARSRTATGRSTP